MSDKLLTDAPAATRIANFYALFAVAALSFSAGGLCNAASSPTTGVVTSAPSSPLVLDPNSYRKRKSGFDLNNSASLEVSLDNTNIDISLDLSNEAQVSSQTIIQDHMSTLINKVTSFNALKDGWDGYYGDVPDQVTVRNTIAFLNKIPTTYIDNLTEYSFAPTSYGTINIEWADSKKDFISVEIGDDQIAYFYEIKGEEGESPENISISSENYFSGVVSALNRLYSPEQI